MPSFELAKVRVVDRAAAGPKIEKVNLPIDGLIHGLIKSLKCVDETHHFVFLISKHELEYSAK